MNGKNVGEEPPERNKPLGTVYSPLATCPECGQGKLDMTLKDAGTTEYTCQSCWKTFTELAMKSYKIQSLMQQVEESKETEKKLRDIVDSVLGWCEYMPEHSVEEKREIDGFDLQALKRSIEMKLESVNNPRLKSGVSPANIMKKTQETVKQKPVKGEHLIEQVHENDR
jgi:hypothetical protein